MNLQTLADDLIAWAVATVPDLQGSYAFEAETRDQPLPDVACEMQTEEVAQTHPKFPGLAIEQAWLDVVRADLLLVVEPEPADTAAAQLKGFVDLLKPALLADSTLGGRVMHASPFVEVSFQPPFVQFDDGSQGRLVTFSVWVADRS